MRVVFLWLMSFGLWSAAAQAKDISVLFIGNSYTYLPGLGNSSAPGLPKMITQIVESIDPSTHLTYAFSTPGGYSFKEHLNDPRSVKVMSAHYDEVILQGQSIESLELTPWWENNGNPGVKSFKVFLPKLLDLVFERNLNVTLYVNWGWNQKHPFLKEGHVGLRFPPESHKAGQKWCGRDKFEYQNMIDDSYASISNSYPVKLAKVGDAWLFLQMQGLVTEDELYLSGDWSHPSVLGSFVAALVLVKTVFHLDVVKNRFLPVGIDPERARIIEKMVDDEL